jgi:GNAT superfamily N-acetyltransferase
VKTEVTTYHLEMNDPTELRPSLDRGPEIEARRVELPCPELNRFFYETVGRDWHWSDRLSWTDDEWLAYLDRPEQQTWVGYVAGTPIGYFELEAQSSGNVEIVYFGLLPRFAGRGFGGRLLTQTVETAWATGARRVWVHTCTLDHPAALANYRSRGFRLFREVVSSVELER